METTFELVLQCGLKLSVCGPMPKQREGAYLWQVESGGRVFSRGYNDRPEVAKKLGLVVMQSVLQTSTTALVAAFG
jgi:hypothetical protein